MAKRCFICSDRCVSLPILCQDCERNLPFLSQTCELCATFLPGQTDRFCGKCLQSPPAYDRLIALFNYAYPINSFIIKLKFQKKLLYARLLGELFAQHLANYYASHPLPDCIVPVPLHPTRLKARGFNQATEILKPIAKRLKIPIVHQIAYRIKPTQPQHQLKKEARQQNIRSAFLVKDPFLKRYKHIAVFDDVMTTGQTLQELSHALKSASNVTIDGWCIAKRMLAYKV